ncbi:MAG: hypothetical protein HC779_06225 [Phyllobacteriaceae bacterium]|nr:hypothetical protein [Phyllobacteriaceae bacterium]
MLDAGIVPAIVRTVEFSHPEAFAIFDDVGDPGELAGGWAHDAAEFSALTG